ncbi:MAG: cytochrome C oxidase subunit IV family protein [Chloroflexi bacterium]|nr:cytochrome C oxidase subunit IV family protein [Chloroflexota bacterium]MBV9603258.1 cytochrome C oxidase subunit IV family protein [Chloroflexota bacterium]
MATASHEHAHPAEHELEHAHPGAGTYVLIGVILAIITVAEVFFYTQESVRTFLVPLLLVLSASKFALVVGFYMHLKFDHPLFFGVFGFGLLVAASIITALLFLFGQYPLPPHAS